VHFPPRAKMCRLHRGFREALLPKSGRGEHSGEQCRSLSRRGRAYMWLSPITGIGGRPCPKRGTVAASSPRSHERPRTELDGQWPRQRLLKMDACSSVSSAHA
jgi:hypothetical protein